MPTCKNCGIQWAWKQSIKASWKFSGAMRCPYCQNNQYATPKSRQHMTLITWLVLLPLPFTSLFDVPLLYTTCLIIGLLAVGLSLIPKAMELSNEYEPLW